LVQIHCKSFSSLLAGRTIEASDARLPTMEKNIEALVKDHHLKNHHYLKFYHKKIVWK
jgi:hypothetical protein